MMIDVTPDALSRQETGRRDGIMAALRITPYDSKVRLHGNPQDGTGYVVS